MILKIKNHTLPPYGQKNCWLL